MILLKYRVNTEFLETRNIYVIINGITVRKLFLLIVLKRTFSVTYDKAVFFCSNIK